MIGERIKKLREWRNYSQWYVAARLGIDQSTYSRIEKGRTQPTAERLRAIAEVLQVPLEDLLRAGPLLVQIHQQTIYTQAESLERLSDEAIERMLAQNAERAQELERLDHRLKDVMRRRRNKTGK